MIKRLLKQGNNLKQYGKNSNKIKKRLEMIKPKIKRERLNY